MGSEPVLKPTDQLIQVLDHGFVRLVDHMGNDASICRAARVSYQGHEEEVDAAKDKNLIRYLMRHRHTSPFEMCNFIFHCKMPIFVARQWVRHRTASLNEVSGRYSELPSDCYLPQLDRMQQQSSTNKQGSESQVDFYDAEGMLDSMRLEQKQAHIAYDNYLHAGKLSRELARINLPLSTYTEWYWEMDLHNLFHFLKLRMDSHAQWEIQQYANAIYKLIEPVVPVSCEAFMDYHAAAVTFSSPEMDFLTRWFEVAGICGGPNSSWMKEECEKLGIKGRELTEFKEKLGI